jgi:hypothetical protein
VALCFGLRSLLALVSLLVLAAAPSALGRTHVLGGSEIDVRSAPWAVSIRQSYADHGALCSGSIVDASHILTAAHCAFDRGSTIPAAASAFTVRAGVSNLVTPLATDAVQDRAVSAVRVHPAYANTDRVEPDDVAVLTLATPLDLGGPAVRAIALPPADYRPAKGQAVTIAGFGIKNPGGSTDGTLNTMNATLLDSSRCLPRRLDPSNAVLLCSFSGTSSPCSGDSGSGLVVADPTPFVVGVTSGGSCSAGSTATFGNLISPELARFVEGADEPPLAPRQTGEPSLERPTSDPQVGQTVTCTPGDWSGGASFAYAFVDSRTDDVVRPSGPNPSYRLEAADTGHFVACRVFARTAGGTGVAESFPTPPVEAGPDVTVASGSVRRGRSVTLRVALVDWVGPVGKVALCSTKLTGAGKLCRTLPTTRADAVFTLTLGAGPRATPRRTIVKVTVRSADGRAAKGHGFVRITP